MRARGGRCRSRVLPWLTARPRPWLPPLLVYTSLTACHLSVGLSSGPWWQGTGGQPVRELCFLRGFLSALAAFRPDRA